MKQFDNITLFAFSARIRTVILQSSNCCAEMRPLLWASHCILETKEEGCRSIGFTPGYRIRETLPPASSRKDVPGRSLPEIKIPANPGSSLSEKPKAFF